MRSHNRSPTQGGWHCRLFGAGERQSPLLLHAPPATPLGTGQYLEPVSRTGANTGVCTAPYQPDQFTDRKAAFGGGLHMVYRLVRQYSAELGFEIGLTGCA
jgi:hypothetical protein